MEISKKIANYLLEINAIKLQPDNPFTWASGWKSPIYCDNRKTLSYPAIRTEIKNEFANLIKKQYPKVEVIAGVATGAIAQGALVAEEMGLPFIYIRSSAKQHGMTNLIEGDLKKGQKVVVIEDLVSTGGSSLKAVEALKVAGAKVLGMVAIFSYGFEKAVKNFDEANCKLNTLSNYNDMIEVAKEANYIKEEHIQTLKDWRQNPAKWMQ
jgi:orotate phosphoribosyltransferase